jgi:hypothetical protein
MHWKFDVIQFVSFGFSMYHVQLIRAEHPAVFSEETETRANEIAFCF